MWRRPLEWNLNGTTDPRDGSVDHLSLNSLKDRHGPIRAPKSMFATMRDFVAWRLRRARWRRREINYATRTQMACPRSRIRLSDFTAIATSVTRRASSRDFKISPITRL